MPSSGAVRNACDTEEIKMTGKNLTENDCREWKLMIVNPKERRSGLEVTKLFFMLNSAEHEIILLISVKMPKIVCILIFILVL